VRQLTATPDAHEFSAKFSPDGERITYAVRRGDEYYIAVMDADGSDVRDVAGPYRFAEFPAWTPDGEEIYFTGESDDTRAFDVLALNLESGEVRVSISNEGMDVCPHFTRDGKFMLYARSPLDAPEEAMDIYAHDVTSTDTTGASDRRLTDDPARDDYASPSPDGTRLVYLADRDGNTELYTMALDGSDERRLTTTPNARENVPDW
jgi:TolB protein